MTKFPTSKCQHAGQVYRLIAGEMPKPLMLARRNTRRYRQDLERAVLEACGEVSMQQAHAIDTATAAESHAAICRWLLLHRFETMSSADILQASREVVRVKEIRDRAIVRLGLPTPQALDPVARFYQMTDGDEAQGEPQTGSNVSMVDPSADAGETILGDSVGDSSDQSTG